MKFILQPEETEIRQVKDNGTGFKTATSRNVATATGERETKRTFPLDRRLAALAFQNKYNRGLPCYQRTQYGTAYGFFTEAMEAYEIMTPQEQEKYAQTAFDLYYTAALCAQKIQNATEYYRCLEMAERIATQSPPQTSERQSHARDVSRRLVQREL